MELENRVVSHWAGNDVGIGLVIGQSAKNRFQVRNEAGRVSKSAEKHLIGVYEAGATLAGARIATEQSGEELDLELLWEILLESGGEFTLEQMAEEFFGEVKAAHVTALAQALAENSTRFRRLGLVYAARTREEVEEIIELRRRRAERARQREREAEFAGKAIRHHEVDPPLEVPEELEEFVGKVANFLFAGHNSDAVETLRELRGQKTPLESALEVMQAVGRLPEECDPFLLVNGIHAGFSQIVEEAAAELAPYEEDPAREDYSHLVAFSIDDEETREVDDALSVEFADGEIIVGIHIADPAYFVSKGDTLDRVASERPLTLYLPTSTVTMLPERIGCDLASLTQGKLRPSLSFMVRFDNEGNFLDWSCARGQVKVAHRLTYEEADEILAPDSEHPLHAAMAVLPRLTERLRNERFERGGFNLNRPELKVRVDKEGEIHLSRLDADTPSHGIVSELMILANNLAAEYALRHDIPILYRTQDEPSEPVKQHAEYNPVNFMNEVRKLKRTRSSTHPQPHSGLGLDVYTQISSPIRRYADLVMQRQLAAHFANEPYPYEHQELLEVMGSVDSTSYENRNLERQAVRHWLLEYIDRTYCDSDEELEAVVVQINGRMIFAELNLINERGLLHTFKKVKVGETVRVRVKDVRPQEGEFILEY